MDHFRTSKSCTPALVRDNTCVLSIILLSLVIKRSNRLLISMITTEMRFMLGQAQQGPIIRVVLHYVMNLLRSFHAHPDHTDNTLRMKLGEHPIEMKAH